MNKSDKLKKAVTQITALLFIALGLFQDNILFILAGMLVVLIVHCTFTCFYKFFVSLIHNT